MSNVTDTLLTFSTLEDEDSVLEAVNGKAFDSHGFVLLKVTGGSKAHQMGIAMGAFNYLDLPRLVAAVAAVPWEFPEEVRLYCNGEHDDVDEFKPVPLTTGSE